MSTATKITDGLTSQQRRLLYDADRYDVTELRCGFWLCEHAEVPALFSVARVGANTVNVISNTLNEHTVTFADNTFHCTCADHQHHPERNCKHTSAAKAVGAYMQQKRRQADAKRIAASIEADAEMSTRMDRNRRMVAGQQDARRLAA